MEELFERAADSEVKPDGKKPEPQMRVNGAQSTEL